MDNVPIKSTGNQLAATEWNPNQKENENVVTSAGDSLGGDNFQLARATAAYGAGGDYRTESGSADAYVTAPIGIKKAPHAYFVGYTIRFRTANPNTGASTVNDTSLGVKNIKKADGTSTPDADDINVREDTVLVYDGTNFRLSLKKLNLNPLHISIFTENDSTDPAKDILFKAGKARDIADTFDINLQANMIKKLDAVWVAGTGNGGRASGVALSANTTYHLFVIAKVDGTTDCGFDTLANATNLLVDATGYTKFRRVGKLKTDSSSNWVQYSQTKNRFLLKTPVQDFSGSHHTSAVLRTLSIPTGTISRALFNIGLEDNAIGGVGSLVGLITSPQQNDIAPTILIFNIFVYDGAIELSSMSSNFDIETDTSAQIRFRFNSVATGRLYKVNTMGWEDNFID